MRVVIQRVAEASVSIEGKMHDQIGQGLLVLAGFTGSDTRQDLSWTARKITQLRIFPDAKDKMHLSVQEVDGSILLVSQFTLFADTKKGNRPAYSHAAPPAVAIPLYEQFHSLLEQELGKPIATGIFGADMQVCLLNDGPVTITLDSQNRA